MAVVVTTPTPEKLLNAIKTKISSRAIETWIIDSDGDFTHSPDQWIYKAWFRPRIGTGKLTFRLMRRKDLEMTRAVYGIYHGRLIEMLVTHFDTEFSEAKASALPTAEDVM